MKITSDNKLERTERKVKGYDGKITPAEGILSSTIELNCPTHPNNKIRDNKQKRNFLVTSLHNEDIILGLPWLADMNPLIDFANRSVTIQQNNKQYTIPLITTEINNNNNNNSNDKTSKINSNNIISSIMHLFDSTTDDMDEENDPIKNGALNQFLKSNKSEQQPPELSISSESTAVRKKILNEFKDIFPDALPAGLPPSRGHELKIKLKPGSSPPFKSAPRINYKHSQFESKWLKDMLDQRIN